MPATIMAIATSRRTERLLPGVCIRNVGVRRFKMSEYKATKIGLLPKMVATRDTEPLCIAERNNIIATGVNISLRKIKALVERWNFILASSRITCGRSDTIRKIEHTLSVTKANMFIGDK